MKVGKYEFDSLEEAELNIRDLGFEIDEHGNEQPTYTHGVANLKNVELEPAEFDDDNNIIKEAVYSVKCSVDVSWQGEEVESFKKFKIDVEGEGSHGFLGILYSENKA